jgi:hypothetical protein
VESNSDRTARAPHPRVATRHRASQRFMIASLQRVKADSSRRGGVAIDRFSRVG